MLRSARCSKRDTSFWAGHSPPQSSRQQDSKPQTAEDAELTRRRTLSSIREFILPIQPLESTERCDGGPHRAPLVL